MPGTGRRLEVDLLDVRQALQALLGALEQRVRQVGALHLAHLAPQHLVVDRAGVDEVDAPHVGAVARVHEERQVDRLGLLVRLRHRVDLGERVAVRAEAEGHQLLGLGDQLARVGLAGRDHQQALQLGLRDLHRAGELHLADLVDLALVHVHRDEHVVHLGRDRDLGRLDGEVGVAAVLVVGRQLLDVALQRLARVAVVLLVPGQPVRRPQLEDVEQLLVVVDGVPDQVDLADARARALDDVDLDAHLVAGDFLDLGIDAHRVLAAAEVLVGQEAAHFLEHGAVEGLAGREADAAQRLLQVLGLDVLVAHELEALDRGPLAHDDHQRPAVAPQLDVAEEPGREQRAHRLLDAPLVQAVADVHRQVVVDRALGDALQALDADVADGEVGRRLRACGPGRACAGEQDRGDAAREQAPALAPRHQPNSRERSL